MTIRRSVLAAAYVFDWLAGDPEWFPHPVRMIGRSMEATERIVRNPGQSPTFEFLAGGASTFLLVSLTYLGAANGIAWMNRRSRRLGFVTETLLAWTCLASRSLHDEASAVVAALAAGDTMLARQRLARIVGRDTQSLDATEISRAVIETVSESACDGVIAPLFYLAIGGVPLAMAYKAVNTLDSMIGHADERYFYFGKVAARLDDAANLLPSRFTALAIATCATIFREAHPATAIALWLRDGMQHKSPNAGQPESAISGALQVRLGGTSFYAGEPIVTPLLGREFPTASPREARQAIRLAATVSLLGFVASLVYAGRRR